ncbi:MAG: hypothetical protein ACJARI_002167 [Bacteroidia bacterium]|jgi:hypothetical protein
MMARGLSGGELCHLERIRRWVQAEDAENATGLTRVR